MVGFVFLSQIFLKVMAIYKYNFVNVDGVVVMPRGGGDILTLHARNQVV